MLTPMLWLRDLSDGIMITYVGQTKNQKGCDADFNRWESNLKFSSDESMFKNTVFFSLGFFSFFEKLL